MKKKFDVCQDCNKSDETDCDCLKDDKLGCYFCDTHEWCCECDNITCKYIDMGFNECGDKVYVCQKCYIKTKEQGK